MHSKFTRLIGHIRYPEKWLHHHADSLHIPGARALHFAFIPWGLLVVLQLVIQQEGQPTAMHMAFYASGLIVTYGLFCLDFGIRSIGKYALSQILCMHTVPYSVYAYTQAVLLLLQASLVLASTAFTTLMGYCTDALFSTKYTLYISPVIGAVYVLLILASMLFAVLYKPYLYYRIYRHLGQASARRALAIVLGIEVLKVYGILYLFPHDMDPVTAFVSILMGYYMHCWDGLLLPMIEALKSMLL